MVQPGQVGDNITLTIDAKVQYAAEQALANGILHVRAHCQDNESTRHPTNYKAPAGAVVVLDTQDGSIVAIGEQPVVSRRRSGWAASARAISICLQSQPVEQSPCESRDAGAVRAGFDVQARDLDSH